MRNILIGLLFLLGAIGSADAATKEIKRGGCIDKFVLSDTDGGTHDGYVVYVLCKSEHKIVYQVSAADKQTFLAYCNQVAEDDDRDCATWDPDPVYLEWDAAGQVNGGQLTPANRRLAQIAWTWTAHMRKAMRRAEQDIDLRGLTLVASRRMYTGALLTWQIPEANADACALIVYPAQGEGGRCTYEDIGLEHLTARIKEMTEELNPLVIDINE